MIDLDQLAETARVDSPYAMWVPKADVAALVRAVRAAQGVLLLKRPVTGGGAAWEQLDEALAPFRDPGGGWPYQGDQP